MYNAFLLQKLPPNWGEASDLGGPRRFKQIQLDLILEKWKEESKRKKLHKDKLIAKLHCNYMMIYTSCAHLDSHDNADTNQHGVLFDVGG